MPRFSPPSPWTSIPPAGGGGGSKLDLTGPVAAVAKTPSFDDADPNFNPNSDAVPNEYVVAFADGAYTPPTDMQTSSGGAQTNSAAGSPYPLEPDGSDAPSVATAIAGTYSATLLDTFDYAGGFSCSMTETQARAMSHDARVFVVEANAHTYCATTQSNPGWGLDRIDQKTALRPGSGAPNDGYTYSSTGSNIDAWIVDTGIWTGAADLAGRVVPEFPNASGSTDSTCKDLYLAGDPAKTPYTSSNDDCTFGHGTLVSSAFGGTTWGVAKGVTFHAVKVDDQTGVGNIASLIAGLNYVLGHAVTTTATKYTGHRSVVNISQYYLFGSGTGYYSNTDKSNVEAALKKLTAKGIPVVVCAGNNNQDAKNTIPACLSSNNTGLITVGASTYFTNNGVPVDSWWSDSAGASNYGSCISIFAPGRNINVDYAPINNGVRTEYNGTWVQTGTSISSPYVAGAVALILEKTRTTTPAQARSSLISSATGSLLHPPSGTSDCLLYMNGL